VDHPTNGDNFVKTFPIFKVFSLLERGVNCKKSPYNISHHTQSVLPHYLRKVKVQICDKLCIRSTFSGSTFSRSVMMSAGISRTSSLSIRGEINSGCYCDMLLLQQLLPVMCDVSSDFFICQQDSAPAHRARYTVRYYKQSTPAFIPPDLWPPNSTDLSPVDYKIWGTSSNKCVSRRCPDAQH